MVLYPRSPDRGAEAYPGLTTATTFGQLFGSPTTQNYPKINSFRPRWDTQDSQRIIPRHVIWGLCSPGSVAPAWSPLWAFQRSWCLFWVVRPSLLIWSLVFVLLLKGCGVQRYISVKRALWVLGDVRTEAGIRFWGVYIYMSGRKREGTTGQTLVFELHVPSINEFRIYGDWKRYGRGLSGSRMRDTGGISRNSRR